jgi:hypothetical protein
LILIPNSDIFVKKEYVKKYICYLRLVVENEQTIKILRESIEAGERSGYVDNFDPVKH